MYNTKKAHHSGQASPQLEQYLSLLGLLVEYVKARPALERAEAAQVGERGEVEVLGLGHREAPDEEVEEAGVVHVYGGGCRVAGDVNACRGLSGRRRAAAAFGGHWALRSRLAPRHPDPLAPPRTPSRPHTPPPRLHARRVARTRRKMRASFPVCNCRLSVLIMTS